MNEKLRINSKKYKFGKFEGITLISLVITIVVLIILASIGIYLGLSDNGIFNRAKGAKEVTNKQTATEIINLKITNCQMNKYAEEQRMPTLKELSLALGEDNEIQYVTEQSRKQASTEYNVPSENPVSIYTKLNNYPYEFEINSSLQLSSINGVKIANNNGKLVRKVISEFNYIPVTDTSESYYGEKTFDIRGIIPNYNKLTKDNFCLQADASYLIGTQDDSTTNKGIAYFTIKSYNDGIITIELTKGVRNKSAPVITFSLIAFYIE